MLLEKLFSIIEKSPIKRLVDSKRKIIEGTDPQRIYVENIRRFFNVPSAIAKGLCDLAVREGVFRKKIGLICPNEGCHRLIKASSKVSDSERITCEICEVDEKEKFEFDESELEKMTFYQLIPND